MERRPRVSSRPKAPGVQVVMPFSTQLEDGVPSSGRPASVDWFPPDADPLRVALRESALTHRLPREQRELPGSVRVIDPDPELGFRRNQCGLRKTLVCVNAESLPTDSRRPTRPAHHALLQAMWRPPKIHSWGALENGLRGAGRSEAGNYHRQRRKNCTGLDA